MEDVIVWAIFVAQIAASLAILVGPLVLLEMIAPRGAALSLAARARPAILAIAYVVANVPISHFVGNLIGSLGIKPLFPSLQMLFLPEWASWGAALVLAILISDFFLYWMHRLQHAVPLLWRFHATHHAVRDMTAAASYHHPLEPVLRGVFYVLPVAFLVPAPLALPYIGTFLSVLGFYLHSPTTLNFGPLSRLIVDNRYHRIHHSREPRHFDRNFCVATPLWDVLFGTAYWPAKDEWPDTGLDEVEEPKSIREWLTLPFRMGRADLTDQ